jgi:hypothetical protein
MPRGTANTSNAQIRKESSARASKEVQTAEADRLLNDPAFQRGFDNVRDGCVALLENLQHDGSEGTDEYEREICRTLRTLSRLKRTIALGVQGQKLRLADFRPHKDED